MFAIAWNHSPVWYLVGIRDWEKSGRDCNLNLDQRIKWHRNTKCVDNHILISKSNHILWLSTLLVWEFWSRIGHLAHCLRSEFVHKTEITKTLLSLQCILIQSKLDYSAHPRFLQAQRITCFAVLLVSHTKHTDLGHPSYLIGLSPRDRAKHRS